MSNEITNATPVAIDPKSFADQLKDKLNLEIAMLMTPEQWQALLESAIKSFTAPIPEMDYKYDSYTSKKAYYANGKTSPSQFETLVHKELTDMTQRKTIEYLRSPEMAEKFNNTLAGMGLNNHIDQLLVTHGPDIINRWLANSMQSAFSSFYQNMQIGR